MVLARETPRLHFNAIEPGLNPPPVYAVADNPIGESVYLSKGIAFVTPDVQATK
jgi:hypothetical protein